MRKLFLLLFAQFSLSISAQEVDFSLARVGERIQGVYIFVNADPIAEYDYIATIEVQITWSGSSRESFNKAIAKAKKKYPNFNAMIFRGNDYRKADLVKFKGLEITQGGYRLGEPVSYVSGMGRERKQRIGKIVSFDVANNSATVQYFDTYGAERIEKVFITNLTSMSEDEYQLQSIKASEESKRYLFSVGEKVNWIAGPNEVANGEIIKIDEHVKIATVRFVNKAGKEKVQKKAFKDLIKIQN